LRLARAIGETLAHTVDGEIDEGIVFVRGWLDASADL